jgi:cellulose synthase/poly-beta-1,6-N-acetylglucosamine synthase-like glycosyltransferase
MTIWPFWVLLSLFLSSWLVYPLLLLLLSSLHGKYHGKWQEPDSWPSVSVLISARNEEDVIAARIRNLLQQDYEGDLEVLVGSDSSSDGTDEIVDSFYSQGVLLHRSEKRIGKPMMIQQLMARASGDIVVFTDADTVFSPSTIRELVLPYSHPGIGCVDGSRRNSLDEETCESIYWRFEKFIKGLCSRMGSVLGATGAVFSIRRNLFRPLSPRRADDFELAVMVRLQGFDCVFNQDAVAMEPSPDDSRQYRRMVRIVSWMIISGLLLMGRALRRGKVMLFFQLLFHKFLRWLSGLFLLAVTVYAGLLADSSLYGVIFICLCAFHLMAALGALLRDALPSRLLFPYYFWLMNWAAIDGILRTMSGHPVETWESREAGKT